MKRSIKNGIYKELPDQIEGFPGLKNQIEEMCNHIKFPFQNVYHADDSMEEVKKNGEVVGIGQNQYILIYDSLLGIKPEKVEDKVGDLE